MGSHPINLAVRFLLELSALLAAGIWGWRQDVGGMRFLLAIGIPIILTGIWGIFAVPNDPSRSGNAPIPVAGIVRLAIELAIFAFACWALFDLGSSKWGWLLGVTVVIHYLLSYDRIGWLMEQ